ncbi:MAG: DsbA family protein [Gammaproteobacteria bacterium]|nr:MAG: DsbA family protein [Gammaproteobacteria bacterium]
MTESEKPVLLATVFTDYICPFCYIGDARLERLREDYNLRINWCFLEIHPKTPAEGMQVSDLGYPDSRWQQMMKNLAVLAEEEGLEFRSHDFTTNSHKALLLAEAAKQDGAEVFYKLHRRLFEAFFTDGLNIGDRDVLESFARDSGVRDATLASAWQDPRHEQRLDQYLAAARELDVRATPTVFFGEQQRLDGALPLPAFKKAALAGARVQQEQAPG